MGNKYTRRLMRIESLTTASAMIIEMEGLGFTVDDTNLTEKEFELFLSENRKLAKRLNKQAERLYQSLLADGYVPDGGERG